MLCSNCNNNIPNNSKFCNNCGQPVDINQSSNYSNNSIKNSGTLNFGENINVTANYYKSSPHELVTYEKVDQRILSSPKRITKWSLIIGVISLISNIASVGSLFGLSLTTLTLPNWIKIVLWIITFICLAIIFVAIELKINKSTRIPLGQGNFMSLDLNERNEVVLSNNIVTDCPICSGTIVVRRLKNNNESFYTGVCTLNPQHLYTFDAQSMSGSKLNL